MAYLSPVALREKGFELLTNGLGVVDTVRFLQQFSTGRGNYTEERDALLAGITLDDIAESIRAAQSKTLD